jgi:hypothetical protein
LKAGKPALSPEFFGFQKWPEVVEFSESEEGASLTRAKERLIVDPDMLRIFTTDAWKTRRGSEQGRRQRSAAGTAGPWPEPPRAARPGGGIQEVTSPSAIRGHPGAARALASHRPQAPPQPPPITGGIREITSPAATRAHPGTAAVAEATPNGFWRKVARLFSAS